MSWGGRGTALSLAVLIVLGALIVVAAPGGPPPGQPRVRTDKNCYLPAETLTITLKNVGASPLVYGSLPDFEVENESIGTVREIDEFRMGGFRLEPGVAITWTWDQRWRAFDEDGDPINKGMLVPRGEYIVRIEVWSGFPIGEQVTIARAKFTIGDCLAQISAGDDIVVAEGQAFRFNPSIRITGAAEIRSVTWDLNPAVDVNGDGNFTNDPDLVGHTPEYVFGDDGIYTVTMNVRGFGTISGKTRVDQDVVFAIDSSGSMEWNDPFGNRKLSAKAYVDRMVLNDRGAVVDFDSFARLVNGDHLGSDYPRIKANIDRIDASGGTFLAAGLFVSLWELRDYGAPTHTQIVIFMTDADSVTARDRFDVPRAIDLAQDLGVKVYTVGLNVVDAELVQIMRQIALQTGAKYFPAATATNLFQIYQDIAEEVESTEGEFFVVSDALTVTVQNVAPTASLDSTVPIDVRLRVAGEKYHDVSIVLYEDGTEVGRASVLRVPGSPDDQTVSLGVVDFDLTRAYAARVEYTPLDDVVNGQVQGADPASVILGLEGGMEFRVHHTFNYEQPDSWVWDVQEVQGLFVSRSLTLPVEISDPGSDDVAVAWDWGDGAVDGRVYLNDPGTGADPFPSPWGAPVALTDVGSHTYALAGTYTIRLIISDDDGGAVELTFTVSVSSVSLIG